MVKKTDILYNEYIGAVDPFIGDNRSFYKFRDEINKAEPKYTLSERYVDRNVDITWLDKIEDSVIALDTILRTPRNFIKDVEEIVPIEQSKKISAESVQHLATHTGLIQSVEGDKVTPSKILNVYKEESFATYENRFIKTLLTNLEIFVEKRYVGLMSQKDVNDISAARTEETFAIGKEKVQYAMEISISAPSANDDHHSTAKADQTKTNDIERVQKVRKIVHDFMTSDFMSKMKDASLVHPPISKTNLLTKNQDYKKALELWQFIESYTAMGYEVNLVDNAVAAPSEYQERMNEIAFFEYLLLKKYTGREADEEITNEISEALINAAASSVKTGRGGGFNEEASKLLRKQFSQILGNYSDKLEEIKNIFVDELEKRNRAIDRQEKKILEAIKRCILAETEMERKAALKRKKQEAALAAREKKLALLEKKKIRAKAQREKLREKKIAEAERIKQALALKQQKARQALKEAQLKAQELVLKKKQDEQALQKKIEKAANDAPYIQNAKLERARQVIQAVIKEKTESKNSEVQNAKGDIAYTKAEIEDAKMKQAALETDIAKDNLEDAKNKVNKSVAKKSSPKKKATDSKKSTTPKGSK